jgi:L-lactate dehydrogenase complex protein LldF
VAATPAGWKKLPAAAKNHYYPGMSLQQQFLTDSERKAFDKDHRGVIDFNMGRYMSALEEGKKQFINLELARRRAAMRKHRVLEHLEEYLKDFEHHFTSRGGKVIWAQDVAEARKAILQILETNYVKLVVKSKSMVTEELELTEFLEKNGIECLETDLGEYIVQISGDKPYHIVTPVMHRSAADIAKIFHEKFGLSPQATPEEITLFVREHLREKFRKAHAGITGANFLVAGSGSVAITENEGNGLLTMSMPRIHIAVAGIERVIPGIDDLELFWPLLATHGTGQPLTAYNSLVNGPRQNQETDGPDQMYVILLDNGRSKLLSAIPQRRALGCIRCGACLNVCPVYRNIGGHTYNYVIPGPIGAVVAPHIRDLESFKHLSFASTLCGKCTEVCPVNIDLHLQLLHNRNLSIKSGLTTRTERLSMNAWSRLMRKRKWMEMPSHKVKNFFFGTFFGKAWGSRREVPRFSEKSFHALWEQEHGSKDTP